MRWARLVLCATGAGVILLGLLVLALTVKPAEIAGVAVWMVCAILVHDGLIAGLVLTLVLVSRRARRRAGPVPVALIAGGLVVAGVGALLFLPEAYAKSLGPTNPTVLPQEYLLHLILFWVIVAGSTLAAALAYRILVRNRNSRSSASTERDGSKP